MTYKAYVVNYSHNWASVDVGRCASTSLKMTVFRENFPGAEDVLRRHLEVFGEEWNPHGNIPPNPWQSGGHIVPFDWTLPSGMVRFAVWRDPAKRLRSLWKWFCCGAVAQKKNPFVGIAGISWEEFCEYAAWAVSAPGLVRDDLDHHIAPQSMLYGTDNVDVVVRLRDLNYFLKSLGSTLVGRLASSGGDDEYDGELLRKAYAADYEILNWGKTLEVPDHYEING